MSRAAMAFGRHHSSWIRLGLSRAWPRGLLLLVVLLQGGCGEATLSTEQIQQDQKRYLAELESCFLREYSQVERVHESAESVAERLREHCAAEFYGLRSATLQYANVPEVMDPPEEVVLLELEKTTDFVQEMRQVRKLLYKHGWAPHAPPWEMPHEPEVRDETHFDRI
jgi:hypothetical protein